MPPNIAESLPGQKGEGNMLKRTVLQATAILLCGTLAALPAAAETAAKGEVKWAPAVKPKPLSDNVNRGLTWLVQHQLDSGAWGQGEESSAMGGGAKLKDVPSVADTCAAALALIRSGSTPSKGPYAKNILAAVKFVCTELDKPDKDSIYVTDTRGTRLQAKLGPYIDTFLSCLLLSEVQETMPDDKGQELASAALDKVLHKLQKNQRGDGTWDDRGWAPALAQAIAVKGFNRAAQNGKQVDETVRARAGDYARKQFDKSSGGFSKTGSAGVDLYAAAASLGGQSDSVNTNTAREAVVRQSLKLATTQQARAQATATLVRFENEKKDLEQAQTAVVQKLSDKRFIAGFGSNGGEEFLSYMNIGESLVVKGGDDWQKWDKSITENMNRIQNQDGSWTGHHCITGRSFCTSAALLVLMVDRTPVPIAAKFARR